MKEEKADQHARQNKQMGEADRQKYGESSQEEALQHACSFWTDARVDSHLADAPSLAYEHGAAQ
ncbi:hypothetical protein [Brevibacillus borstelensis]|uniref:hypothetical protein n=1 Tax=Brevibacillus TaxID=55080 RepID=UPI0039F182BF